MKLSVIIPCYNERSTLESVIEVVLNAKPKNKELIIVDDMSTDGSRELLQGPLKNKFSKVIFHEENKGKGAAIQTAISHATGDIVIIQDADLEYDPNEYEKVIKAIIEDEADVVYGSRFLSGGLHSTKAAYKILRFGNKSLTFVSNIFSGLSLTDMETCYKAFRREIIQSITIKESRFGFEPEITAKIAKIPNIRIKEVPISYAPRSYEEGKKIGYKDGIRALYCIVKYNWFSK